MDDDEEAGEMTVPAVHPDSATLELHREIGREEFRKLGDLITLRQIHGLVVSERFAGFDQSRHASDRRYGPDMPPSDIANRVRALCMGLPEATERLSHGSPAFFVKKQFVMLWPDGHHDHDFPHLWCAAPVGAQAELIAESPDRYFRPPYVGARGWVGVRLDHEVDWDEVAELCKDAYRVTAPARLVTLLDQS